MTWSSSEGELYDISQAKPRYAGALHNIEKKIKHTWMHPRNNDLVHY